MMWSTIHLQDDMRTDSNFSRAGVVFRTHRRFAALTPREREVLQWVVQGKSNGDIAIILGLALRTVKKHLERVFAKLGIHSRSEAMALYYELVLRRE